MKRRVRKEDVIRTTWQLITRHGIRAVRVDEIAQCLGMSKRTLYELFPDKTNLIAACLEQTSRQQKEKITQLREEYSGDPLQKLFRIIGKYLGDIYLVDCEFLSDMKEKSDFTEAYNNDGPFLAGRDRFGGPERDRQRQPACRRQSDGADRPTSEFAFRVAVAGRIPPRAAAVLPGHTARLRHTAGYRTDRPVA